MEPDKTRARNLWVDNAKAIGIILVVYGHVARGVSHAGLNIDHDSYKIVDSVIYSFHMPLFFFLSGLFLLPSLEKRGSLGMIRIKFDTIIYPYVVWSILQGLIEVSLSRYVNGTPTLGEVFSFAWLPRAHFWFLYVLFFAFVLAALLYRRSSLAWCSGVFIGAIIYYLFGRQLQSGYLFTMLSHYFVFFCYGVFSTFLIQKFNHIHTKWMLLFLCIFISSQWIFHVALRLNFESSADHELLLLGLISVGFVVVLAQWLTRFNLNWLTYLGRQSMTIYLLHIIAGSGCRIVLQKVFGISDVGIHLLVGTTGGILLPLLFYSGCMRFGLGALFTPPKPLVAGER